MEIWVGITLVTAAVLSVAWHLFNKVRPFSPAVKTAGPNVSFRVGSLPEPALNEIADRLNISVESVHFDFLNHPERPTAQVVLRVTNDSKYDVLIKEICWQITVGVQGTPSVRGVTSCAFLLFPQASQKNITVKTAVDYAEASYISRIKEGVSSAGFMEGILIGRARQFSFTKKFLVPNVTCLVERSDLIAPARMFIDPTHLDSMTGLFNHKFLADNMQSVVDGATDDAPVSFVMIDVDDFKSINDECGHLIGDDVLKIVTAKIRETVGDKGFAVRYAGDEFSILLANHRLIDARVIAEKIRSAIADYLFTTPQKVIEIRVSVGVAAVTQRVDYKTLIQQADDCLMFSKRSGKNQVSDHIR